MKDDGGVWVRRPLASLATVFTDGDWIESKDQSASGIRLVQTGNVGEGEFKDRSAKARYIDLPTFERLKCFEVHPGDILVSRLPDPVGRSCVVPDQGERMITAVDCSVVRVDKSVMDERFLVYYTQSESYLRAVDERCTGTTRRRISRSNLGLVEIPVPPVEEQRQIVAILDQAFAALDRARAHAETNLADAQELFATSLESIFREAGSASDTMLLADAVHPDCTLSYGIVQPGGDIEGGLPIVRPVDLKQRIIKKYSLKRISPDRASGYARTRLVGGELLLCVRGSTGEVSVADAELKGANVTRGIVPIRFNPEEVLPEFAYFQFRSPLVRDQIAAKTYGAALMQINIKDLRALSFFVPPIQKQKEMVVRLERLLEWSESLRDNYESQLKDIAALRQSLLQQAFSGKLT